MAISLKKGEKVSLSKNAGAAGLAKIHIGLGWDARVTDGKPFDADASAFLLTDTGKVKGDEGFIFYNQKLSPCGSVEHMGDNQTGEGDGDDEVIVVNLQRVPAEVQKIVFTVTIHEAEARKQNFGMVSRAYIRIVNKADDKEIARFDLSEEASTNTAMIFGEMYRHSGEWKFRAVGQGFAGGLSAMAKSYGLNL